MIAITNGKVMTITQGTLKHGTVLVEDGRIVAVGEEVEIPEGTEVYDAIGKVVMPGLIDAHCHVGVLPDGTCAHWTPCIPKTRRSKNWWPPA